MIIDDFMNILTEIYDQGSSKSRKTLLAALNQSTIKDINDSIPKDVANTYSNWSKRSHLNVNLSYIESLGGFAAVLALGAKDNIQHFDNLQVAYDFIKTGVSNGTLIAPFALMADGLRRLVSEYIGEREIQKYIIKKCKTSRVSNE